MRLAGAAVMAVFAVGTTACNHTGNVGDGGSTRSYGSTHALRNANSASLKNGLNPQQALTVTQASGLSMNPALGNGSCTLAIGETHRRTCEYVKRGGYVAVTVATEIERGNLATFGALAATGKRVDNDPNVSGATAAALVGAESVVVERGGVVVKVRLHGVTGVTSEQKRLAVAKVVTANLVR